MQIAVISDIHGNLPALEAVLADAAAAAVDQIVCLGDVALAGPQPRQVIARLQALRCPVVMGNTDAWALAPQPHPAQDENSRRIMAVELWGVEQLTAADLAAIAAFQPTVTVALGDGATLLCFHGSPRSNTDLIEATTPDEALAPMLAGFSATVLAGGHTHTPMLRRYRDATILLNPGSVGLPFQRLPQTGAVRNPPWAEYAIVGQQAGRLSLSLQRVPYDVGPLIEAAYGSGMPHADWWTADWR